MHVTRPRPVTAHAPDPQRSLQAHTRERPAQIVDRLVGGVSVAADVLEAADVTFARERAQTTLLVRLLGQLRDEVRAIVIAVVANVHQHDAGLASRWLRHIPVRGAS